MLMGRKNVVIIGGVIGERMSDRNGFVMYWYVSVKRTKCPQLVTITSKNGTEKMSTRRRMSLSMPTRRYRSKTLMMGLHCGRVRLGCDKELDRVVILIERERPDCCRPNDEVPRS